MADKGPKRNLAPESEPWGRSVDQQVGQLQGSVSKVQQENANAFKAINSSMKLLSGQIATLTDITSTLVAQQQYLSSLISRDASTTTWATDSFVGDGEWHWFAGPSITMPVATGKARIMLRTDEMTAYSGLGGTSGGGTVGCGITYGISSGQQTPGSALASISVLGSVDQIGIMSVPVMRVGTKTLPPGTYTFTCYTGYNVHLNNAIPKSVSVKNPAILVDVVNND